MMILISRQDDLILVAPAGILDSSFFKWRYNYGEQHTSTFGNHSDQKIKMKRRYKISFAGFEVVLS